MFRSIRRFQQVRSMFIQTEPTPNKDSLKFIPGKPVLKSTSTMEFLNVSESGKSPLAKTLFKIDGVDSLMFGPNFVTITKHQDSQWQLMKPDIYAKLMDFFSSDQDILQDSLIPDEHSDTKILPGDSETVAMIKELLETRIRPTIQDDGGDIEYCGFDDGIVKLKLKVTLKNGIENMLMHYIPEIKGVEQVESEIDQISANAFKKLEDSILRVAKE